MATFIDNLGAVSVPLNSGRLLIRQSVNGTDVDSKITFANLVANLVNSSSIGSSSGQIPQLVTGTYGVALPTLSGENLTNLDFSTINIGTGTVTGTTKLSDSLVSTSGTTGGFAATPNAVRLLKADYTNLLTTKANVDTTNTFSSLQTFSSGVRVVGDMKPDTISITDITNTATSEVLRNNSGTLQWKGINIVLTTALGTASAKNLTTAGATIWDTGNLKVNTFDCNAAGDFLFPTFGYANSATSISIILPLNMISPPTSFTMTDGVTAYTLGTGVITGGTKTGADITLSVVSTSRCAAISFSGYTGLTVGSQYIFRTSAATSKLEFS